LYDPLFPHDEIRKEVNNINSEHESLLNDDYSRILQVEKDATDETHPFNHFDTGKPLNYK